MLLLLLLVLLHYYIIIILLLLLLSLYDYDYDCDCIFFHLLLITCVFRHLIFFDFLDHIIGVTMYLLVEPIVFQLVDLASKTHAHQLHIDIGRERRVGLQSEPEANDAKWPETEENNLTFVSI